MDLVTHGIVNILTVQNVLILGAGVMIGMVVGVIPGLGPSAGLAILLPLTFGLDPTSAIVMLAAVYYGAMYGGTITSVLINTPGESATVASTFDGYPLAKQGRAGPALVMAAVASFVAGTIGAILISVAAPVTASVAGKKGHFATFQRTQHICVRRLAERGFESSLSNFRQPGHGIQATAADDAYFCLMQNAGCSWSELAVCANHRLYKRVARLTRSCQRREESRHTQADVSWRNGVCNFRRRR